MRSPTIQVAPRVAFRCRIAASGSVRAARETIAQWRKQAFDVAGRKLSATLLKHADDQTLMALRAISEALDAAGWQDRSFAAWGVIAAPNFFGRPSIAQTIERFRAEGAWGIAPNLIPNYSLHAVSGTISQLLSIHGPNFGIGGGPNAAPEAFLLVPALLADTTLPGLWLVVTGHECECIPAPDRDPAAPQCHAAALALVRDDTLQSRPALMFLHESIDADHGDLLPELNVASLCEAIDQNSRCSSACRKWRLATSHWLQLDAEARP